MSSAADAFLSGLAIARTGYRSNRCGLPLLQDPLFRLLRFGFQRRRRCRLLQKLIELAIVLRVQSHRSLRNENRRRQLLRHCFLAGRFSTFGTGTTCTLYSCDGTSAVAGCTNETACTSDD